MSDEENQVYQRMVQLAEVRGSRMIRARELGHDPLVGALAARGLVRERGGYIYVTRV